MALEGLESLLSRDNKYHHTCTTDQQHNGNGELAERAALAYYVVMDDDRWEHHWCRCLNRRRNPEVDPVSMAISRSDCLNATVKSQHNETAGCRRAREST